LICSHPLLPLYLTSNNRGIISLWSYSSESKKSLDEFYLERPTKDNMNRTKQLKKLKFNSYGDNFLVIDESGNLYIFPFYHTPGAKLPKITLWTTNSKSSKDAVFLNNSGLIATTMNKSHSHTTLWDFLLPMNQSNVGEVNVGGNLINTISTEGHLLICNDKPGYISFIDIRKMEVVSTFQAHLDEIKAIKISDKENFIITMGHGIYF
jgi:hypothetical protein